MWEGGALGGGFDGFVVVVAVVLRCSGVDGFGHPGRIAIPLARPRRGTVGAGRPICQTSSAQRSGLAAFHLCNEAAVAGLSQFDGFRWGDGSFGLVRHGGVDGR